MKVLLVSFKVGFRHRRRLAGAEVHVLRCTSPRPCAVARDPPGVEKVLAAAGVEAASYGAAPVPFAIPLRELAAALAGAAAAGAPYAVDARVEGARWLNASSNGGGVACAADDPGDCAALGAVRFAPPAAYAAYPIPASGALPCYGRAPGFPPPLA